jgi:hypothetical protein
MAVHNSIKIQKSQGMKPKNRIKRSFDCGVRIYLRCIRERTMQTYYNNTLGRWMLIFTVFSYTMIHCAVAQSNRNSGGRELVYGENWGKEHQADLAAFSVWANNFLKNVAGKSSVEGVILAKQRRAVLYNLIMSDPAQAIAAAVPENIRKQLPAAVVEQLEIGVSGIGDLSVLGAISRKGGSAVEPIQRFVQLNGHTYRASVYGRRASETTKHGIPMHGLVIDDVIALHENGLRILADGEMTDPSMPVEDLRTPVEKAAAALPPTQVEMGGTIYGFASSEQMQAAELRIEAAEAGLGPNPSQTAAALLQGNPLIPPKPSPLNSPTAWTTGTKNVLITRVDFSDLTGIPEGGQDTQTYVQNLADSQISPYYAQSSYGQTALVNTVTPKLYRMPQTAAYYATNGLNNLLVSDAENIAAADYTAPNYDRVIILFSNLGGITNSQITYGGLSDVGGPNVRCNGEFDFRVIAHELGHTYGLYHANLWAVTDGNPISPTGTDQTYISSLNKSTDNYGDDYDTMGANYANDQRTDLNPNKKNILGWVTDAQVQTVTASGTYRIYRFDNSSGTGTLALKIAKDGVHNYWVCIRREFTDNASMQNGAYIVWAQNANNVTDLLDMNTPGNQLTPSSGSPQGTDQDAALAVGASFTDSQANIAIRPLDDGGSAPNEYMDIEVDMGPLTSPVWVDFAFNGSPKNGTFANPYTTLADGVYHVSVGGDIFMKGPQSSSATIKIMKPMKLNASGGSVTIGH